VFSSLKLKAVEAEQKEDTQYILMLVNLVVQVVAVTTAVEPEDLEIETQIIIQYHHKVILVVLDILPHQTMEAAVAAAQVVLVVMEPITAVLLVMELISLIR
jgi:hypothetical protein